MKILMVPNFHGNLLPGHKALDLCSLRSCIFCSIMENNADMVLFIPVGLKEMERNIKNLYLILGNIAYLQCGIV